MASNVVNLYLVELDCFIALLSALLSLWWSSICWICFLFHGLCCWSLSCGFFLHLTLVSFVPWFVLSKFVFFVLVWLWKWGLFCCVWFVVCVFLLLWKFDLLGLFCLLVCDFSLRGRLCLILFVHCVESC